MALNTEHLLRTAATLEQAMLALEKTPATDEVMYDLYCNAAIKSFELSLETAGKLLRKALKTYGGSPRSVDALVFNDVLRHGGKHSLLDQAAVERWLSYRANRNSTAHDYGVGFANDTLTLLPAFLSDVRLLAAKLQDVLMPQVDPAHLLLSAEHLQMLRRLLAEHVPDADVWAYGSRVSGDAHEGSDLDIVLRNALDLTQDVANWLELKEALQDSTLPMLVDVHLWSRLPESFQRNIETAYVVL